MNALTTSQCVSPKMGNPSYASKKPESMFFLPLPLTNKISPAPMGYGFPSSPHLWNVSLPKPNFSQKRFWQTTTFFPQPFSLSPICNPPDGPSKTDDENRAYPDQYVMLGILDSSVHAIHTLTNQGSSRFNIVG
ncbi:hypothetical protein ACTHPF_21485 [Paenibacillus sp. SAF-054]|uniref:hypothetical protein n=1 Tax=unclassified Paenibacillus TaxID=185978 RepID=UPI003F7DDC3D